MASLTSSLTPTNVSIMSQSHFPIKPTLDSDVVSTATSTKPQNETNSTITETSSLTSSETILPDLFTETLTPTPLPAQPKKRFNREEYQRNYNREWGKRKRAKIKELITKQGEELMELKEKIESRFDEPIPFTLLGKLTNLTVKELSDFIEKVNKVVEAKYENHLRKLPALNQRGFHSLPAIEQMLLILSS
jgi:hypothetical protein